MEHSKSDTKILTLKIAREWDCTTALKDYTSIDDDAAEVLANCDDADLDLLGLTALSAPTARSLSKQTNGSLNLSGLTSLDSGIAEEFSKYAGFLSLDGLTSLSVLAAHALSKSVQSLSLAGLASVSDSVAEVLSKSECHLMLSGLTELTHPGLAAKLVEQHEELNLSCLTKISESVAIELSKSKGKLILYGLNSIPNFDLAWKLFLQEPHGSCLGSLTSLSAGEAATISDYLGDIYLDNLAALSETAAETLSGHEGLLGLRGLTSLTGNAAEALSKHNGILILPPIISRQVADHFLRRFIGGILQTAQAPGSDGQSMAGDLKHGKLYDCKVDSEYGGEESTSIFQLAIDATTNRRFVLFGARDIYRKDPEFVHKLINLDFYFLFKQEYGSSKWNSSIQLMFLDQNGVMLRNESKDACLYGFREKPVIT